MSQTTSVEHYRQHAVVRRKWSAGLVRVAGYDILPYPLVVGGDGQHRCTLGLNTIVHPLLTMGAEHLYTQAGTSLVNWQRGEEEQTEMNVHVRPRPAVSFPPFTFNRHLRSHPTTGPNCSDVGYAACHRGTQECDLFAKN